MKTMIIAGCASLLFLHNGMAAQPTPKQEQKTAEKAIVSQPASEDSLSTAREQIETHYADQLKELKLRAAKELKQFEDAERDKSAQAQAVQKNRYIEENGVFPRPDVFSEENKLTEQRIEEGRKSILAKMEPEIQKAEDQKKNALAAMISSQENPLPKEQLPARPEPPLGTVTGILYGTARQLVLINHEIATTGDVLYGVTIVQIHRNAVEFEKDGKRWTQRTGESPERSDWQKESNGKKDLPA